MEWGDTLSAVRCLSWGKRLKFLVRYHISEIYVSILGVGAFLVSLHIGILEGGGLSPKALVCKMLTHISL